ncbi:MAG: hypothetical protein WCK58_18195, partial [Chloroflexota bacterium]
PDSLPIPLTPLTPFWKDGVNGVNGIGSPVSVSISCRFNLITPVVSAVLGSPVTVSAGAAFPVRNGTIFGVAALTPAPTHHSDDDNPTPTPTPTSSADEPTCRVPFLIGNALGPTDISWADDLWRTKGHNYGHTVSEDGAGFSQPLVFNSAVLPNSKGSIKTQDKTGGTWLSCSATVMTVTWGP